MPIQTKIQFSLELKKALELKEIIKNTQRQYRIYEDKVCKDNKCYYELIKLGYGKLIEILQEKEDKIQEEKARLKKMKKSLSRVEEETRE
jgi:hypothetical protein